MSSSAKILVVDDDAAIRTLITRILATQGWSTLEAGDGLEALFCFTNQRPRIDLIISDIEMPQMGGLELRRRVLELAPDLPFLFVSEVAVGEENGRLLKKPVNARELCMKVRTKLKAPGPGALVTGVPGAARC